MSLPKPLPMIRTSGMLTVTAVNSSRPGAAAESHDFTRINKTFDIWVLGPSG